MTPEARAAANSALSERAADLARGKKVAAYSPLGNEPGGKDLLPALAAAAEVWLPISGADGQLLWCLYRGPEHMAPGALGIAEPTGPRLDSSVLSDLDLLLVPALGLNPAGVRLGKGAGYYDRALAGLDVPTVALIFGGEIRADIPAEPHDVPVDAALTPTGLEPFRARFSL